MLQPMPKTISYDSPLYIDMKAFLGRLSRLQNRSDFNRFIMEVDPLVLSQLSQSDADYFVNRLGHFNYYSPKVMRVLQQSGRLDVDMRESPDRYTHTLVSLSQLRLLPRHDISYQTLVRQLRGEMSVLSDEQVVQVIESVYLKNRRDIQLFQGMIVDIEQRVDRLSIDQLTRLCHVLFSLDISLSMARQQRVMQTLSDNIDNIDVLSLLSTHLPSDSPLIDIVIDRSIQYLQIVNDRIQIERHHHHSLMIYLNQNRIISYVVCLSHPLSHSPSPPLQQSLWLSFSLLIPYMTFTQIVSIIQSFPSSLLNTQLDQNIIDYINIRLCSLQPQTISNPGQINRDRQSIDYMIQTLS